MKAVIFRKHGDLSVLETAQVEDPEPGPGEVRISVKAVALNHLDVWVRKGWPGLNLSLPHILGSDISGKVDKLGADVEGLTLGDEVVIGPGTSCGQCDACESGKDNRCPQYAILGEHISGGYAEFVVVPAKNVFPKPTDLSFVEAACLPLVYTTAWGMLVEQGRLRKHETVLIHAGGSGVGSAAIQIAKSIGATVITTASSDEKLEKAKALGADFTINYSVENFSKRVWEITEKRGVEVVFEHTGGDTFPGSLKSLAIGGRLVTCGATTNPKVEIDIRLIFARHLSIIGNTMGSLNAMIPILENANQGLFRPVLDQVRPLEEAAQAQQSLINREQFGKIVLTP